MKNIKNLFALCALIMMATMSCNNAAPDKPLLPFNYNVPNIYAFAVKTTNASNVPLHSDTLGLMCTDKIFNKGLGLNCSSWLFLTRPNYGAYMLDPKKLNNTTSGTRSTNDSLFIHPPRDGRYTILQICAYPILHFPLFIGQKWAWDLTVGGQWSPGGALKWTGNENFSAKYEVTDTTHLEIPAGKIICYHIHAIDSSKFGTSSAEFYYSYKYGIVKMVYLPLDNTKIEFNLIATVNDPVIFNTMIPHYNEHEGTEDFLKRSPVIK